MYELFFRRKGKLLLSFFAVLSVMVFVSPTFAQTTGNLQGIVRDPNGAVVAGATVKVTNTATGIVRETTTNEDGLYRAANLLPGTAYKVEVSAAGFSNRAVENVTILLATENSVDVDLGVQGASGEVTVTSEAPLIDSNQSQLSTSYSEKQLTQLPIAGGSIDNLALLTPGVLPPGDTDFSNGVGISANGNRGRSNNFQLDGQDNNDNSVAGPTLSITNTEAIADYQITTNAPSAESGRNAGAQINAITRSGTNEFRGAFFEYFSANGLNSRSNIEKQFGAAYRFLANNGFSQLSGLADRNGQNIFTNNRFGGRLGGPIVKNRAFFFVTFQADIQNGEQDTSNLGFGGFTFTPESIRIAQSLGFPGATSILGNTQVGGGPAFANVPGTFYVVPALQDSNGDGVVDSFLNPGGAYTRSEFVCRVAPVGGACPAGQLVTLFTGEAIRVAPFKRRGYQLITQENINITDKDTLTARYIYDNTRFPDTAATGSLLSGASFDVPSKNNNLGVTYTRLINSTFTNVARFNFSRLDVRFGDPEAPLPGPGITFTGQRDLAGNSTSLSFGTGNTLPQSRKVDVYQEQDTLSAAIGNHFIKLGVDFRQQKVANYFLPNFLGVYRFRNTGTNGTAASVCSLCQFFSAAGTVRGANATSTAFENLLLGRPERITFALGNPNVNTTQNDFFYFAQDDWRVRSNLTLNLGLRYEYSSTPFNPIIEDINAREANAATAIFNTAFPLEFRTAQKIKTDKNNFGPRVGFAYSPDFGDFLGGRFDDGRTVLRAGFSIAYDPSFFNIVLNTVTAAPFAAAGNFTQTPGAPGSVRFPFLPSTTQQLNTTLQTATVINGVAQGGDPRLFNQTRVDPNFYNPYTIGYNAGIQHELFKNTVLEVRFVGSRIIGQYQTVNGNPNIQYLNRLAQCIGVNPGSFTSGNVVGSPAPSAADACAGSGFNNRSAVVLNGVSSVPTGNGRLDPNFGPVRLRNNGATATYGGLQTRFETRFSDLVFVANYTLSRTIDNASEIFSTFAGGQSVANSQNPFDTTVGERGLSAFHQKHNFTSNFIYDVPFFKEQKGVVGKLLGGYRVSGIIRLGSGRPYTPIEFLGNVDPAYETGFFSGVGPLRPFNGNPNAPIGTIAFGYQAACQALFLGPECDTYSGGTPGPATPGTFIIYNTLQPGSIGTVVNNAQAAMQQARLVYNDAGLASLGLNASDLEAFRYFRTPYGNVGRNTFLGSNFYRVDMGVFKTFKVTERIGLEFRAEGNNIFNERNFGVPDAITEDASFGNFVGSFQNPGYNFGSARSLTLGFRVLF